MPLPSKAALELISWLAERDEAQLHTIATLRELRPQECRSLGEMAQALLSEENTKGALGALAREPLYALHALSSGSTPADNGETLVAWGLWDGGVSSAALFLDDTAHKTLQALTVETAAPTNTAFTHDAAALTRAAARAWGTICMIEEVVEVISTHHLSVGREGLLSATAKKTLSGELGEGYDLDLITHIARVAKLVAPGAGVLRPGPSRNEWGNSSPAIQWAMVAQAWWSAAPSWWVGTTVASPQVDWNSMGESTARYHYPCADISAASVLILQAHALGLLEEGRATPWALALAAGENASVLLEKSLPDTTPGVFAHEDLTFLATGPLGTAHRSTLNAVAHRDLGGLVPRYRLTQASLLGALHQGYAADSMVEDVRSVCANPLPHAMVSLIEDTIRRAHDIIVRPEQDGTTLTTSTPERASELLIDPRLQMVNFSVKNEVTLLSSWPIERVHTALTQASWPALMEGNDVPRPTAASDAEALPWTGGAPTPPSLAEAIQSLVSDLRSAASRGVPAGVASMIEVAIAGKIPLEVSVEMPDESLQDFVLEPRALSGGRLRGVELRNATERTLPVSRIRSLRAVEA